MPCAGARDLAAWEAAVAAEPARAVAGINYFQAHVFARAVGWLLASDPSLFRLPSGVELELAAFGPHHDPTVPGAPLYGAWRGGGVRIAAAEAAATMRRTSRNWPPTAAELFAAGDYVVNDWGEHGAARQEVGNTAGALVEMTGLDFGVREWVIDLPVLMADRGRALAAMADHVRHLEAAAELATLPATADAERAVLRLGVVRGVALDELARATTPLTVGRGRCSPQVPGVVQVLQLARDGSGVPNELDPHLSAIGMRLCGGRSFLQRVRR